MSQKKVVIKGVIIKGVYCISIRWVWNSVVQILESTIDTCQILTQVYAHSPKEGDKNQKTWFSYKTLIFKLFEISKKSHF
jgi:hypothetical protein